MNLILIVLNLFIIPHLLPVEEFQKSSALACKINKYTEFTSSDNFGLHSKVLRNRGHTGNCLLQCLCMIQQF